MKKLVLFDIDSTIIDHTKEPSQIPEETKKAIQLLHENGHYVGIATGRNYDQTKPIMEALHIRYSVTFTGHLVKDKEKVIYKKTLHKKEAMDILNRLRWTPYPAFALTEDEIYIKDFFGKLERVFLDEKRITKEEGSYDHLKVHKLDYVEREYMSVMFFKKKLKNTEDYKELDIHGWGNMGYYDVYAKGVSKLTGIYKLMEYLDVNLENVYVFGDSYNDIHMLEGIPNSVAVGNGEQAAKDAASYVAPAIQDGGILKGCQHFGLI